jgi:hypothetical protein
MISDLYTVGAEQNVCYFVDYGLGELKVSSQVISDVLLSMLGFLDDAVRDSVELKR